MNRVTMAFLILSASCTSNPSDGAPPTTTATPDAPRHSSGGTGSETNPDGPGGGMRDPSATGGSAGAGRCRSNCATGGTGPQDGVGGISGGGAAGHAGAGGAVEPCVDGPSPCCPPEFPTWCNHHYGEAFGHCFKEGADCSTITVCDPEPFARSCPTGDYVVCWETACLGQFYGGCRFSEYQCD